MKAFIYFFIIVLPLACTTNSNKEDESEFYDGELSEMVLEEAVSDNAMMVSKSSVPATYDKKVIKNSYLRFETEDLDKTYDKIIQFVKQNEGFIQNDNSNKSGNRLSRNLEIRIPTSNFQKTIDSISRYVSFFDTKRISARDVTEEFIDLEARLKAKQTLEKRYLELLSKANSVKEMLEIERELSNIREEIEAKQGRLKYLNDQVSLSTLNIEFYKITSQTGVTVSYGSKMWKALKSGFNGLSIFFLALLNIWPFIIIILIGFFVIKRWINKKK
ncbi:DUF4349 domain-containing protein [Yeosuana sp. MJ-SS3]|jgi:predicted  nucleic acid-binding Zn-ribbon protein|uniref:DUF4349 domain-containing protein n=1 Tax=Gilvirhabdus luticola TaxID=3079858 RepID=A0ABU3U2S4_9FLAO|nr:DUF4349 domain-containing protein [Yeosuana sp. MJ-SS3]MDU8884702.1 DUF4349 domain-containing protein [Yeosuana sp. MJ-SS3]